LYPADIGGALEVEGEVPDSEWPGMVDEIRRALNNVGQVSQFGRSFSWVAARRGASQRDLEVAVSEGATMVRVGTLLFGGKVADEEMMEE